jgi:hypothetical protein
MKTDRYTKVVLTPIAVGLFLNVATNLPVQPAFAQHFPSSFSVVHTIQTANLYPIEMKHSTKGVFVKLGGSVDTDATVKLGGPEVLMMRIDATDATD